MIQSKKKKTTTTTTNRQTNKKQKQTNKQKTPPPAPTTTTGVIIDIFGQKCLEYIFNVIKGIVNGMLYHFGLLLNTVVKIRRKKKIILQNDPKKANNKFFLSKICEYWTDVHLCIVKLESGGEQLSIIKKMPLEIV